MMKKILSLLLALMLTLSLASVALAVDDSVPAEAGYYYVYTENGKSLNVRESPGGRKVGSLKYGARIHVDAFTDENWALILYTYDKPGYGTAEYAAFVNRRFLTKKKPAPRTAKVTDAPAAQVDAFTEMNQEYRSARKVDKPYTVRVRPTRVSGWVALYWAPSVEAEILSTYKANDTLTVLWETDNWLQAEDPETGVVGFVRKNFIAE